MALFGLAFAASGTPLPLMAAGVAFQLIGAIYIVTLNIYAAEAFPTTMRAAVSSTTWAINRVAAALVPIALLPVLKSAGALAMFSIVAACLARQHHPGADFRAAQSRRRPALNTLPPADRRQRQRETDQIDLAVTIGLGLDVLQSRARGGERMPSCSAASQAAHR